MCPKIGGVAQHYCANTVVAEFPNTVASTLLLQPVDSFSSCSPVISCIIDYLHIRMKKHHALQWYSRPDLFLNGQWHWSTMNICPSLAQANFKSLTASSEKYHFRSGLGCNWLASIHHQPGIGEVGVADRLATRSGAVHSSAEALFVRVKLIT